MCFVPRSRIKHILPALFQSYVTWREYIFRLKKSDFNQEMRPM
jgi:hypothetical protein